MKLYPESCTIFNDYPKISSDYSINITHGLHKPNRYVEMKHGTQYGVTMKNNTSKRCQASLSIDGEHIGDYIIDKYASITIHRPLHSHKQFTFYRSDSDCSFHSGIIPGRRQNGVVEVTFIPERNVYTQNCFYSYDSCPSTINKNMSIDSSSRSRYSEGGTALSGHSNQEFIPVKSISLDYNHKVILSLRLVAVNYDMYDMDIEPLSIRQRPPPPVGLDPFPEQFPEQFPDLYFNGQPTNYSVVREY